MFCLMCRNDMYISALRQFTYQIAITECRTVSLFWSRRPNSDKVRIFRVQMSSVQFAKCLNGYNVFVATGKR